MGGPEDFWSRGQSEAIVMVPSPLSGLALPVEKVSVRSQVAVLGLQPDPQPSVPVAAVVSRSPPAAIGFGGCGGDADLVQVPVGLRPLPPRRRPVPGLRPAAAGPGPQFQATVPAPAAGKGASLPAPVAVQADGVGSVPVLPGVATALAAAATGVAAAAGGTVVEAPAAPARGGRPLPIPSQAPPASHAEQQQQGGQAGVLLGPADVEGGKGGPMHPPIILQRRGSSPSPPPGSLVNLISSDSDSDVVEEGAAERQPQRPSAGQPHRSRYSGSDLDIIYHIEICTSSLCRAAALARCFVL